MTASCRGKARDELPTPCLLLDLTRFEANLDRMQSHAHRHSIALRPHAKTHKCVDIARRQIEAGGIGICTATIAEAEMLARAGITGLLITSEMVGKPKIDRLITVLAKQPDTMVVIDDASNVGELNQAAAAAHVTLPLLIDLDIGSDRTGVQPGEPALALAGAIRNAPNLRLRGISAYAAQSSHTAGFETRRASSQAALAMARQTWDLLVSDGFDLEILSGGSTGTYNIDPEFGVLTELQVGSYIFMDADYRRIGNAAGGLYEDFAPSLTVLATVIHRSADKAVIDAGYKALATDRTCGPEPRDLPGATYRFYGDEHGVLNLKEATRPVKLGDRIELIVPNCDPNVNLYDRILGMRGETVEVEWPVMERAAGPAFF